MNYQESIAYLENFYRLGIHLGLGRINLLLNHLGNPQQKFKAIHIAGTNGKGSVAAMLSSILREAGYKVGTYTSPHLFEYPERIKVNWQDISKEDFAKLMSQIKPFVDECQPARIASQSVAGGPTEFEILTALAFLYFAQMQVEVAVVEVGLGGRLDATNVVDPLVTIITNIDYDHTHILGETLEEICKEKTGIIKTGVPLVTAESKKNILDIIIKEGKEKRASSLTIVDPLHIGSTFDNLPLFGFHQKVNAATAVAAAKILEIRDEYIRQGLAKTSWPGRFQIINKNPLTIVDGAHNPAGARCLREALRDFLEGVPVTFVLGILEDKDIDGIVDILAPSARQFMVAKPRHPRAADPEKIAQAVQKHEIPAKIFESVGAALAAARNLDHPICVTGSLFTAAEALKLARNY